MSTIGSNDTRYLRRNPHVTVIAHSSDEVVITHGTRSMSSEVVRDTEHHGVLRALLERLNEPASLEGLVAEGTLDGTPVEALADALQYLERRGVIVDAALTPSESYARTIGRVTGDHEVDPVVLAGAGALAQRLRDRLGAELGDAPTGMRTHPAAADGDALRAAMSGAELWVLALDEPSPTALHAVNDAAIETGTAWMPVQMDGSEGIIGPVCLPGETACYLEFELQTESASRGIETLLELKEHRRRAEPRLSPWRAPHHVDIVGGLAVEAVLSFMRTGACFALERALRFDFERSQLDTQDVLRIPRCPACGPLRAPYRNPFL